MLEALHDELAERGATLRVAEAHAGVRDLVRVWFDASCFNHEGFQ